MTTLHLVACGKLKRSTACAAQDLYVGDLFQKARAYAERRGPWAILSAKHGLVLPTTRLEPYNQTLIGASPAVRVEWAALVARQLREAFPDLTKVVFLAGRDYRYPLEALLSAAGVACSAPMQGLGLGQQKQWLMRNPTDAALLRRVRIHADTESYPEGEAVFTATLEGKTIGTLQIVNPSKAPEESELYESAGDIDGPMALMVFVHKDYRRRGVAQALYAAAEKHFGEEIAESPDQTAEGAALRKGIRNPRGMRAHYDFSKGRRNVYAQLLGMPRLSKAARRQLRRGTRVEMEHTRSRKTARLIAAQHLVESPRYYQALAKMERRLKRKNPMGGEWWIDEGGRVEFADQDAGDMGHEAIVAEKLTREFLDRIDSSAAHDERVGTLADHEDDVIAYLTSHGVGEEAAKNDPINELHKLLVKRRTEAARHAGRTLKDEEQFEDAFWIAATGPSGRRDARAYAMKYDGWKRVSRRQVETWTLTHDDLAAIRKGLGRIWEEWQSEGEIPPDTTFDIEVRSTKKYYTGVPWSAIDSGDLSEVTRGRATNPPLGNTGWEFKQAMARAYLLRAIWQEGGNVRALDELIDRAFHFAKDNWQRTHNRILPHSEWPALRVEATLSLAQLVASGKMRQP